MMKFQSQKMGKGHIQKIRFLEKVSNKWKLVGQTGHHYENNTRDTISYIQTVDVQTGELEVLSSLKGHFEANWHPDNYLILNSYGKLYKFDIQSKKVSVINTGFANACNNDHGISPDKKMLVISNFDKLDSENKTYKSSIYTLPINGGTPKLITKNRLLIGMVGVQMARHWHIVQNEMEF
jgi:Tol biopolymer transport system component